MFNPFPELLTYGLLAPFIIRTALGFAYLRLGMHAATKNRHSLEQGLSPVFKSGSRTAVYFLPGIEILAGLALILGFYTQVAAIITAIISLFFASAVYFQKFPSAEGPLFNFLAFAASLSLILSGAGFFALDRPF